MRPRVTSALGQTVVYGAGIAVMKAVSLLMLPFLAHQLSAESLGRLEVIGSLAVIGSVLAGLGMEDALFRHASAESSQQGRKRMAAAIFGQAIVLGFIVWIAGMLLAERLASLIPGNPSPYELKLVLSVLALEGCIAIPLGWLRMQERAITFFLVTTGRAALQALLVLVLVSHGAGVEGVLEAGLVAALAQALLLGFMQLRETGASLDRDTVGVTLRYSLPIVGSGLVAVVLNGVDRWMLAASASLEEVAHFGVAAKFALAVVLLMQPFGAWWSSRRFATLNSPGGHARAAKIITIGVTLTLFITVLTGLAAPLLVRFLLPANFEVAADYAIVMVLVMALRELAELLNLGCFTGKTTGTQLGINLIASLAGFAGMWLLIPDHGVWGLIGALLGAQALRVILFTFASQRYLPLPFPAYAILAFGCMSLCWLIAGSMLSSIIQQLLLVVTAMVSMLATALALKLIPAPRRMKVALQ